MLPTPGCSGPSPTFHPESALWAWHPVFQAAPIQTKPYIKPLHVDPFSPLTLWASVSRGSQWEDKQGKKNSSLIPTHRASLS